MISHGEEYTMTKKIIAVNAGPRKGWNTDTLIIEATKGAQAAGAQVEKYDLFRLDKYTGCISCFSSSRLSPSYGLSEKCADVPTDVSERHLSDKIGRLWQSVYVSPC